MDDESGLKAAGSQHPRQIASGARGRIGTKRARCLAIAGMMLAGSMAATARADAPLTWGIYTAAPYSMLSGPSAGEGIFDRIRHLLDAKLGSFEPRSVEAPFGRIMSMIRDGAPWCFIGGIKTPEREAFATFSKPIAVFYPLSIVVHKTRLARFDALAPLSLVRLLQNRGLQTSLLQNRAMGPDIDPLLQHDPPALKHSDFDAAMRMLLADRIDYLLEYANIASYTAQRLGSADDIAILPMVERPQPLFSRVMCPRTPWGLAVVEAVDRVLADERPGTAYRSIVEAWSDPATVRAIDAIYDTRFLTTP